MGDVLNFERSCETRNLYVRVPRNACFFGVTRELSDFMAGLPIDRAAYDRLLQLVTAQTLDAEKSGFFEGMRLGMRALAGGDVDDGS